MTDGAHQGITAERALGTILGGKPAPAKDEAMSDADFAAYIRCAPDETLPKEGGAGYGEAAREAAYFLLAYLEKHPEHRAWPLSDEYDWKRHQAEGGAGMSAADLAPYRTQEGIWDRAEAEEPRLANLNLSGFQAGWAFNAARKVLALAPRPNPALLTIG